LFRLLLVVSLSSGMLAPMLHWEFNWLADASTRGQGGEELLYDFFARFYQWLGGVVLLAQLFGTSFVFRWIGLPLAVLISPLVFVFGFVGLSIQLSLSTGVVARVAGQLQDKAVYDPALRVLFSLFPESIRSRAAGILEGPAKRLGGALGNTLIGVARSNPVWVGYAALPIALSWLVVAFGLWRAYPRLLLHASATRGWRDEGVEAEELLDPGTVRALAPELCSGERARCQAAIALVAEAPIALAVAALAEAVRVAPEATRPLLVQALDRLLEARATSPPDLPAAGRDLEWALDRPGGLSDRDRADLVQAYGRLLPGNDATGLLERALSDPAGAVRLAALAALERRRAPSVAALDLDAALDEALGGHDPVARRTAREEYRTLLLCGSPGAQWEARLARLTALGDEDGGRVETAEALAEVARRHGEASSVVAERVLAWREDQQPRVRAALLRYTGYAGLVDSTCWLVDHVGSKREEWSDAAQDALRALGPACADLLLRELAYGRRSKREGILAVVRELAVGRGTLRTLYERELDSIRRNLMALVALGGGPHFALVRQRLAERVEEELHTALLFLAAIRDEDRIAELGDLLRRAGGGRRYAILLEALEAVLGTRDGRTLVPLLEERDLGVKGRAVAADLGLPIPTLEAAVEQLLHDPEELTRTLAEGTVLAVRPNVDHDPGVLKPVEIVLHLKTLPLFEGLTTRQLMDLAGVVREQVHPAEVAVVREGDYDDCLYLIVDGMVRVTRGDTTLNRLGPRSFFGEMAVFEGAARSATVTTETRVRLLRLERADLLALMEELPGIAIGICQMFSRRVRELTDLVET
jgi:hypothetical protein